MPVSEERLYNPERLNRWFAISSVVMTVSILWMIQVDYNRPWRGFQDDYYVSKAAFAHLDYIDTLRQENVAKLEEAERRLADAEDYAQQVSGTRRAKLVSDLAEADLAFRMADGPWGRAAQVLQVTRDTYERVLGEHGAGDAITLAAHARLAVEEEELDELQKTKELWEDRKAMLEAELRLQDEPVRAARKRLEGLQDVRADALRMDRQYRGVLADSGLLGKIPIVKTIINIPLGDFTAPKNTPGRHQVNQLVLPDVRMRLNYMESYTTDRCTTCHVAIDDESFSKNHLAGKLERSLAAISEVLQSAGESPLEPPTPPTPSGMTEALPAGRVTEHWDKLSKEQQDAYFHQLLTMVNQYLEQSGRNTIRLGQPILAHPNMDLYVSVDSPHAMARMGCTVCHEGNGQETDFVQAAHTPSTHEIQEEWERSYYALRLGVPSVTFETVEHYWDRPMHTPEHAEAGCAKCHGEITDISRFRGQQQGSRLNLGRHLFTTVGCVNCHNVDAIANQRRVGPDLTHVASKLSDEFVEPWVFFPQKFRPSTRMPHFFMQENNRAQSANAFDVNPVVRTETEVAAMTKYLFAVSRPWEPIPIPKGVEGDVKRGRRLFRTAGCLGCHANLTEFGEEWIQQDLTRREGLDEEKARHRYLGMTFEQRVRYAMEHFVTERDTFLHPDEARFDPEDPDFTPVLTRFAPELSGMGSKTSYEWLYSWLMDPTRYAPDTKMPSLRLRPSEAADLAAYLMTLTRDDFGQSRFDLSAERREMADELMLTLLTAQRSKNRSESIMRDESGELTDMLLALLSPSLGRGDASGLISAMSLQDKKLMYLGSKSIGHYGCYACHKIPGFEETTPPGTDLSTWAEKPVAQLDFAFFGHAFHQMREENPEVYGYVYPRDADDLNSRSPIDDLAREQITHTHAAFAKHKMLNPRIWDRQKKLKQPYDKLKMPNFYFSEKEAGALTTYLLSRVPPRVNDVLKIDYEGDTLGPIAAGRSLTRELNCVACHQIEENAPTIQQYFRRKIGDRIAFDSINAPPSLWGEGAKVQHNWLHRFLQHVEPLRPWLSVRMPSFNLTGEESTALVEYFAALSSRDSSKLAEARAPIEEYIADRQRESSRVEGAGRGASSNGADWYQQASLEDDARQLRRFVTERKLMRPANLDPLTSTQQRVRDSHAVMLGRIDFIRDLYDVEYPFVEPPKPLSMAERFALGSRFFSDMGCLKCHVLGNMLPAPARNTDEFVQTYRLDAVVGEGEEATAVLNNTPYPVGSVIDGHTLVSATNVYYETGDVETSAIVEGPSPDGRSERIMLTAASAPNLALTYQRLRREWVFQWMLEPQWIQPGTKMPQNFPDGESPFEGSDEYPGTAEEHIDLLVDFLYHAGAVGARMPLLKIVATDESEEFDDEDLDEEEFDD